MSTVLQAGTPTEREGGRFPFPDVEEGEDGCPRRLEVDNRHPGRRINRRFLRRVMLETLRSEDRAYGEVDLILLDDGEMRRYNREYHGEDFPTDHLGFQYDSPSGTVSGDLMVCLDACARQAAEYHEPFNRELARLAVHGILHLCGWRDGSPAQRRKMRAREDEQLDRLQKVPHLGSWIRGPRRRGNRVS